MLRRLAHAERTESCAVRGDVPLHFDRIDTRVLTQRPADCLAYEEVVPDVARTAGSGFSRTFLFSVQQTRLDAGVEEFEVRVAFESDLTEDRGTPLPEV